MLVRRLDVYARNDRLLVRTTSWLTLIETRFLAKLCPTFYTSIRSNLIDNALAQSLECHTIHIISYS